MTTTEPQKDVSQKKAGKGAFFMFTVPPENLAFQVEHHDTLPITKSARGVAVITIAVLLAFGVLSLLLLGFLNVGGQVAISDLILGVVIYLPFLYFVYRGHLWAMIGLMLLYTVDKILTLVVIGIEHINLSSVIFWLIGIGPIWAALTVERAYRKKNAETLPV